jgi:hypothetical protein
VSNPALANPTTPPKMFGKINKLRTEGHFHKLYKTLKVLCFMISSEDIAEARRQLAEQVEKMLDGQQKESARQQLASMTDEAISAMVEQQRGGLTDGVPRAQKSVFRMIVDGSIPSKKIVENNKAIAVVSIRPVSKGHVIIIPRDLAKDAKDIPSDAMVLAKEVAKKMMSKLKSKSTEIQTSSAFDETILNVIPVYNERVDVNSKTYEASGEELQEVYGLLRIVKKPKKEIIRAKKKKEEVLKLKRRVP